MTLRAVIALFTLLLAPLPGLAFGDCTTAAYRISFDDRLSASATCHVQELNPIEIGERSAPVRVLRFDRAFDSDDAAWLAAVNDTIGRVGFAASAIGTGLRTQPVTIVMMSLEERYDPATPDVRSHTGPEVVHGAANWGRLPTECPVSIYKIDEGVTTDEFAQTLAHELFHCIQFATWTDKALEPNGWWWIEGSAEYFGVLAVPEHRSRHYLDFGRVSQTAGLVETGVDEPLDYENAAFFSWLHQQGGGPAVGAFLSDLP